MPSNAVVIVVVSFLLLALIYSSSSKFHVFALNVTCNTPGTLGIRTCCYDTVEAGKAVTYCALCVTTGDGITHCGDFTKQRVALGGVLNPQLGNAQIAPGTPPPGSIIKVPPGPNAATTNNNTGTPPPGSIIKVPPGSVNPAGNATGGVIKVPPLIPTNPSNNTGGTPPPPPAGQGCGPGTDNSTCSTTSNPQSTPTPPPTAQTTCPDGSQPDSSGKCPTSNPNTSVPPPSSNNNNPPANNAPPSGGSSSSNGGGSGSSNNYNNGGGTSFSSGTSLPSK
jgi:hypothetical protein